MPSRDYLLEPRPRPLSPRGWSILGAVAFVVGVLYVLAALSYNAEGGSTTIGGMQPSTESVIIATLEPKSIDSHEGTAIVHVNLGWQGADYIDSNNDLKQGIRITADTSMGTTTVEFPAGESLGQFDVTLGVDGEEANYPFDVHEGLLSLSANTYTIGTDLVPQATGLVPLTVQGTGGVSGWDTVMDLPEVGGGFSAFTFSRAFSTQAFALLLIAVSVLVSVSALAVAVLIYTSRRRMEAALLSWGAALLFALPVLRNYMPNSPPIGATIDIFIYLWTIVMAGLALILLVLSWSRQKRAELEAAGAPAATAAPDGSEAAEAPHAS